jgi:hypothetical protein
MIYAPDGLLLTINTISDVDPEDPGAEPACVRLTFLIGGEEDHEHLFFFSPGEAALLAGWLERGEAGSLEDDGELWLSVDTDGRVIAYDPGLGHSYSPVPVLAALLRQALEALASHPPRRILDHRTGWVSGTGSGGEPCQLTVAVQQAVSEVVSPRLMLEWQGTWWLTNDEGEALAAALEGGSLALHAGGDADPWLRVLREEDRVQVRLFDDLVEEGGHDGVLWLDGAGAAELAVAVRAALIYQATHPAYVFVAPEPLEREVVRWISG